TELSPSEFHFALLYLVRFIGISGILMVTRDLTKKQSEKAFWVLISSSVLFALAGFALFQILPDFTEAGLTELGWDPHIGRLTSTFLDPNFAAGLFAFLLALLGGRFLREKKAKLKIWTLLAAFALGAGLLLTFSRSGLLALGVSGLVLGIFVNRRILVAGAFIVLLGIASSPRLAERIGELAQSVESLGGESQQTLDPTAQLRFDSWSEGWRIFEENSLIGVGFGAYKFHQDFSAEDSHAATGSDSSLLNIAAMTGTLGFLVFGILLWNLASAAWHSKNWGFLAGISGLLVHSIFVNSLLFAPIAAIFFVSAGLNTTKKIGARERIEAGSTTVPK
ncbi:MAG: O-antigen ligase family protein, partial [Candidatus Peribacteraceae bacterium]|nr:O-antigen ligase family protein [Candidatus Peribacteraceae bacterium]